MRVEVYWNLHKKCWSVSHKGKVIDHAKSVYLQDVQWVVQPGGQARVRRQGRKNVHAFARGTLLDANTYFDCHLEHSTLDVGVRYNPYLDNSFVTETIGEPVTKSRYAALTTTYHVTQNFYRPTAIAHITPPWSTHDDRPNSPDRLSQVQPEQKR